MKDIQTPEERFKTISNLRNKLETNFVEFGEILSEMKRMKTYKLKGYKTFKEFIAEEYNLSNSLVSKVISIYDIFIKDMNIDSETVKEIGIDRLNLIKPLIKDKDYTVQEEWVKTASELSFQDLNLKVKDIRDKEREDAKTLKDIFTEQFLDNMKGYFNCSGKELNYKLALYFQDSDLEKVNEVIRERQKQFEEAGNDKIQRHNI